VKAFALVRGVSSGTLYLYPREVWEYMMNKDPKTYGLVFEFVVDSGDKQELVQLQALVNKDIEMEE
jgi:hypothetical protein